MSHLKIGPVIDARVLEVIETAQCPLEPKEVVLEVLKDDVSEDRIRASLWKLIDRNVLQLNPDWTVTSTNALQRESEQSEVIQELSRAD